MTRVPSNHRQAERVLVLLVRAGRWRVDEAGRVWRRVREGWRLAERRMPSGYVMVRAMVGGRRVVGLAHRLAWQVANGNIPDGLVINHRNGVKHDNRLCNLEVATYGENITHARRVLGRAPQAGERNNAAKLSPEDVAEIRLARERGERAVDVATRFGVRFQHVYRLWKGQRWPHLKAPRDPKGGDPSEWPVDLRVREFPR